MQGDLMISIMNIINLQVTKATDVLEQLLSWIKRDRD